VTGLLLLNLGTPDAPTTPAVRRYLREFLSDPRVIDINPIGRALLLNLIILPFRPAKSAAAYRKVWNETTGSPLLMHSRALAAGVQAQLGAAWKVELGMRYGNPSIASALEALRGCDRIVVIPLFPQYAASSTATAVARVMELAQQTWDVKPIEFVGAFYAQPKFLDAFATVARPVLDDAKPDHVLFSFHGLPERQIRKSGDAKCLASPSCCERTPPATCYRAQCFATARELAARLAIVDYTVCFQSRLGRTPWITPHTDVVVEELAKAGKRRLAVFCPAFVADCLETLEEIGLRLTEQWRAAGGEALTLVPSLNATPAWVDAVCTLAVGE
jgi:ferrochelatase